MTGTRSGNRLAQIAEIRQYGASIHANILNDGSTHYALAIATPNNPHDLADH
jgi:hypothetical protein